MAAISEMSFELSHHMPECGAFSMQTGEEEHDAADEQPPWISDDNDSEGDTERAEDSGSPAVADGAHPNLDMDVQRQQVAFEKQQRLAAHCAQMAAQHALTSEQQTVALKIVMHEAHRLQRQRDTSLGAAECDRMWQVIGCAAVRDIFVEGHAFVQRRLSCMCIFNPHGGRKEYVDSDNDRLRRQANQQAVLKALRMQAACGGSDAFLKSPTVAASASSFGAVL